MQLKTRIRNLLLPKGRRPWTVRGGRLKGMRLMLDLHLGTQPWRGVYETRLQEWLVEYARPGDCCLDIGAAEGHFTLLMGKLVGPTGVVFAFEPTPAVRSIQENFDLNPAVSLAKLHVLHAFVTANAGAEKSVCIDQMIAQRKISRVDVVKIDVDGAEVDVLESMKRALAEFHPHLFIEVHSKELLAQVESITQKLGYSMTLEMPPKYERRLIAFNAFYYSSENCGRPA